MRRGTVISLRTLGRRLFSLGSDRSGRLPTIARGRGKGVRHEFGGLGSLCVYLISQNGVGYLFESLFESTDTFSNPDFFMFEWGAQCNHLFGFACD